MAENRYEEAAAALIATSGIHVAKYRSSMTGCARIRDGQREIEIPRVRGAVSFGVLAHEIGHHVLGHVERRQPRWIEEVEAWEFALKAVQKLDLPGYDRVYRDALKSIEQQFYRALRRGVKPDTIAERFPAWWNDALHGLRLREIVA